MIFIIKNYAIVILLLSIGLTQYKCNTNRQESPTVKKLLVQKMTPIKVPEPSGLASSFDKKSFWSVGDSDSKVYKLDLSGKILKSFSVSGEDLEGITVIDSKHIAVVLERSREVVVLDTSGNEIKRKKINLTGRLNEGLEGISFDTITKDFYLVNEKRQGLLLKTDSLFNEIFRKEIKIAKDYSDIFFAIEDTSLWILSDESKKIINTNLDGDKIKEYKIDVTQPEGLVVDYKNKLVYVVSDKKEALYIFTLPN
ncbi:MAG: SdiA-regulated domain-containing protein [Ignavibacteriaceae bacterium]